MPAPQRDKLRTALTNLQAEKDRLTSLQDGRNRAREQRWALGCQLRDAQYELRRTLAEEPSRLAHAFAAGEDRNGITPVEAAQTALDRVQAEHQKIEQVEEALDTEIVTVSNNLRERQTAVCTAMSRLVISSPEYQSLLDEHRATWKRLRTIREALHTVNAAMHGQMPQSYIDEAARAEPLVVSITYPADPELVTAWATALAWLEQDADAELPHN
jgi:chromosome segregation ATPase